MARPSRQELADAVLERYPRTYGEEVGAHSLDRPSGLYRVLVMSLLMSARIKASIAVDASRALFRERWTTPQRMLDATWAERTRVLNRSGYARYDESTSRMLADTSQILLDEYGGDLRRMRDDAERDPDAERRLLKQFKGIGDVGVDIFFREVQRSWDELRPFADRRALAAAERLGIGKDAKALTRVASDDDVARLVSALARVDLDDAYDEVRDAAARR